jgi:hypothetical protein
VIFHMDRLSLDSIFEFARAAARKRRSAPATLEFFADEQNHTHCQIFVDSEMVYGSTIRGNDAN